MVTLIALVIGNGSLIAANLGVSTGTAFTIVNFLDAWSSVATVITIVGMFTGVGTISAGVAAILAIIKKKKNLKLLLFNLRKIISIFIEMIFSNIIVW